MGTLEQITTDEQLGMLPGVDAAELRPAPEFSIIDHELPGPGANGQLVAIIPELRDGIGKYILTGEFGIDLEYMAVYARQYMQNETLATTIALGRKIGLNHALYANDRAMQERMQTVSGDLEKLISKSVGEVRSRREYLSEWRDRGECKSLDPELMFPARGEPTKDIKAMCAGCSVVKLCLKDALSKPSNKTKGILGGTSERERRALRHDMRATGLSTDEYVDIIFPLFMEKAERMSSK